MWGQMQGRNFGSNQFQGGFAQNFPMNQFQNNFSLHRYQGNSLFNNQFQMYRQFQGNSNNANQLRSNPRKRHSQKKSFSRRNREKRQKKEAAAAAALKEEGDANQTKEGGAKTVKEPVKEKVLKVTTRNRPILVIPSEIKWPSVALEHVTVIKEKFLKIFQENVSDQYLMHERAKLRRFHSKCNDQQINRMLRKKASKLRQYKNKTNLDKLIANLDKNKVQRLGEYGGFTMHALTRAFETEKTEDIALVMVHKCHVARFLPQHILLLCQLNNIPACAIEGLGPVVCKLCDITRSSGIYFKKMEDNPFQELIDFIIERIPNISNEVPAIDALSEVLVPLLKKNAKETIEIAEMVTVEKIPDDETTNEKEIENDKEKPSEENEDKVGDDDDKKSDNEEENSQPDDDAAESSTKDVEEINKVDIKETNKTDVEETKEADVEKTNKADVKETNKADVKEKKKADVEEKKQTVEKKKEVAEPKVAKVTTKARRGRKK